MKNLVLLAVTILLGSSLTVSCASINGHLKYTHRSKSVIPIDAFAYVDVSQTAVPGECLPTEMYEECKTIIKEMPPYSRKGTGSGLLVWSKKQPISFSNS